MEKLPRYCCYWIASFQKQRYTCEMLPLETKQSGSKLLRHSELQDGGRGGGGFLGELSSSRHYRKKDLNKLTSQIQDFNVEYKNPESRRQIGKFEKGNAEERGVCSRCQ